MRVAIDTSGLALNAAGTSTYIRQLTAALRRLEGGLQVITLAYRPLFSRRQRFLRIVDTLVREFIWTPICLPRLAAKAGADVLHAPALPSPRSRRLPLVVTVYDLYSLRNPAAFTMWQRVSLPRQTLRSVRAADKIIAISEFTKSEILACCPEVSPKRVAVVPLACGEGFRPADAGPCRAVRDKYRLTRRFILAVSTLEPRKNLERLLQAFARVTSVVDHDLVLVGPPGWKSDLRSAIACLGLESRVRLIGFVEEADLQALYSAADLFVYPSVYEGFGLPPLEAMACGCPVITSNTASLPEVVGDAAVTVDPLRLDAIAEAITRVLASPDIREDLRRRALARVRQFSWTECALRTRDVYLQALGNAGVE